MIEKLKKDDDLAKLCRAKADEMEESVHKCAIMNHVKRGRTYTFEVNAYGNDQCTDDGNTPI